MEITCDSMLSVFIKLRRIEILKTYCNKTQNTVASKMFCINNKSTVKLRSEPNGSLIRPACCS